MWGDILSYDNVSLLNYLQYCINETQRIDPSSRVSTPHCFTETINIGGKTILKESSWHINIYALHNNPKEWIDPSKFIPDRFDPESPYYLTPQGTKRHPMSFGPFLGGRRICVGKTFAENIIKCLLTVIIN